MSFFLSAPIFSKELSQTHNNPHSIKGGKLSQCVLCHGPDAAKYSPEEKPEIYEECSLWNHCSVCHGKGAAKGDGKAAAFLYPKPRDLNSGILKFRSSSVGEPPSDDDIFKIITEGVPGSSMPSFAFFTEEERWALVDHIKTLTGIQAKTPQRKTVIPESPPVTPTLLGKGKYIYNTANCWECHGKDGKGDGPKASTLRDDWGYKINPRDFSRGIYKGGSTPGNLYLRIALGIEGTPMLSYGDILTPQAIWSLAHYIRSLATDKIYEFSMPQNLAVKKVESSITMNPASAFWKEVPAIKIYVSKLWQEKEELDFITVRSAHNGKKIAFLLEFANKSLSGAALQFPVLPGSPPPAVAMGEKNKGVNIWYWSPEINKYGKFYAEGIGTLAQFKESKGLFIKKYIEKDRLKLLFVRDMKTNSQFDFQFAPPQTTFFAIAYWDKGPGEKIARKKISTWYKMLIE